MTITGILYADLLAAALLAFWTMVRFPRLGPKSLGGAIAVFLVAQVLGSAGPALVGPAIQLPFGFYVVLVGIALPMFFLFFLTTGWLFRLLAAILRGSGPGGGHRIRGTAHSSR
jgi:uncharacterized transporter YbjL